MSIKTSEDLIKRSDAITAVAQLCAWHGSEGAWVLQEDVIEALENVTPNESKQEWIPCSERLPSAKGEYLVTYHPCHWDFVESEIKVGIDMFRGKTTWAKNKYQRVIAWMPLPEPYKEGE